ncbi:Flavonol synthase [Quillaja saponaria]|uniref:Flavonol synthase n=1 Tax=Quillaja saponaria TaxID=32244 RepID=A0AAD7KU22_QUISA|nr:Flavonol synthase [Quillaja saponaria]
MEVERVQAIASTLSFLTEDTIPAEFIRPETEQPAITTFHGPVPEIPTIDLSEPDQEKLVQLVSSASKEWGIFQVVNHGIPNDVINKLQSVGKEFFELPQQEKEAYAKPPGSQTVEGYGTNLQKDPQGKKSWVDHLFHRIWPPSSINFQFWPKNPPSYREANEVYAKYVREVVEKLFTCLSLGLGLEGNVLKEASVPGLQVQKDDHHWFDAKYIPNALIIHVGDQIQILTNGKYKSVLHRTTVNKEKARMSWPVFLEPPAEFVVGPLPQLVNEQNPPKYKAKKFKDYAYCKLNKLPQ